MEKTDNLKHWEEWASHYGSELRATTKCLSIKRLEIEALLRHIDGLGAPEPLVLEMGCGNGANGFALVARSSGLRYIGLDFSSSMIGNAIAVARRRAERAPAEIDRTAFGVADARELAAPLRLDIDKPNFTGRALLDVLPAALPAVVFTDRMLINLSSATEQKLVMERIAELLPEGGLFLMIENSVQTHAALNDVRVALGLVRRSAAEYNVFIDEEQVIRPLERLMKLVVVEDFSAIHDLVLYVIGPALAEGRIEYDSPLMTRLTDAIVALGERASHAGAFGQNRLWVWRK